MNKIAGLEVKLTYFETAVQNFNYDFIGIQLHWREGFKELENNVLSVLNHKNCLLFLGSWSFSS